VLSLPDSLRFRAAFNSELMGEVLGIFIHEVFASLRKRARDQGVSKDKCGSVTVVQRFGSAANLHLHFHAIVFDGVLPPLRVAVNKQDCRADDKSRRL
jgi:hypothetical protein